MMHPYTMHSLRLVCRDV